MMGRQTSDQSQLFYLFNLEERIPASGSGTSRMVMTRRPAPPRLLTMAPLCRRHASCWPSRARGEGSFTAAVRWLRLSQNCPPAAGEPL